MKQLSQNYTDSGNTTFKFNYLNRKDALVLGASLAIATTTTIEQNSGIDLNASSLNEPEQILSQPISSNSETDTETNKITTELELLNRYNQISKSDWFQKTYHGKSIGQITGLEM